MFTEAEVRFLSREHAVEGLRPFPEIDPATLRDKEQSLRVIQRVMEERARKLGRTFTDFQGKTSVPDDLAAKIQSSKLW
jgi:hypothetical protein